MVFKELVVSASLDEASFAVLALPADHRLAVCLEPVFADLTPSSAILLEDKIEL